MVDAPSLDTSQVRLDGALSDLIELKMSPLTARGWNRWPLKVPSNPNPAMILCLSGAGGRTSPERIPAHSIAGSTVAADVTPC